MMARFFFLFSCFLLFVAPVYACDQHGEGEIIIEEMEIVEEEGDKSSTKDVATQNT